MIFLSYTSADRAWAQWIGVTLRDAGHEMFVHEWEIGPGENIPEWMERRLGQADKMIGVFSPAYVQAIHSNSERWAAYWHDPGGRNGFLVPIEVAPLADWPIFAKNLRRLSLVGKAEEDASHELIAFFEPPSAPKIRPPFPGPGGGTPLEYSGWARSDGSACITPPSVTDDPTDTPFSAGGAELPVAAPGFPPTEVQHVEVAPPRVSMRHTREDIAPVAITDRASLETWLETQPREVAMIIAARAGLRVVPLLSGLHSRSTLPSREDVLLPLFCGMASIWAVVGYPDHEADFRSTASAAYFSNKANSTSSSEIVGPPFFVAASTATHAAAAAAATAFEKGFASYSGDAAASSADAAATVAHVVKSTSFSTAAAVWAQIERDAQEFVGGTPVAELASRPLWNDRAPDDLVRTLKSEFEKTWTSLKRRLVESDPNWRLWTDWWEARRDGRPADEEKELARLTLPEEIWQAGAKVVNAEIKRRFDEIDARRAAEAAKPSEPEQIEGSRLELTPERGLGFPTAVADADVGDPAVQAALHGQLRKALPRLQRAIATPNHTYDQLEDVLAEYHELVDVPTERLDVALVWGAGAALLGMADAFEAQNTDKTFTDPLEPQQLALLKQAAQLHGAFILGFPLAQRLMGAAERFKLASDTIAAIDGPTAEMLRRFGEQHDWVEESARKFIASLGTAYHRTGWTVTASGYSAYVLVRNALVVVTRHLARANSALATIAGGLVVGEIDPGLEVTRHAMLFVLEHTRTIMAFAQPFPELRAWFGWVIDHLDEQSRR